MKHFSRYPSKSAVEQQVLMRTTPEHNAGAEDLLKVEVHQDIAALRDPWCAFQKTALGGPHDTWEWNEAWERTAGNSRQLQIVIGRNGAGDILFLLPLTIRKRKGFTVLEWSGSTQGNYASGLFHPTAWQNGAYPRGEALMARVLTALPRVDAVHLANQPAELGGTLNPLGGLPGIRAASPGHSFQLNRDWEAHFKERYSSSSRSKLRRAERRLKDEGTLDFTMIGPGSARIDAMDRIIGDKQKWFTDKGIHNFFEDRGMREFYLTLAQLPDDEDAPFMRIYECRLDGESVAANLGIIHQNKFYGLIASTMAGPVRRHGPGRLLFLHLVEHLAHEGIEMIDCGAGEDDDKLRWCTEQRERLHAIVPVSAKGHVYAAILNAGLRTKILIKNNPQLWNMAKCLRQWSGLGKKPPSSLRARPAGSSSRGLQA